MSALIQPFKTIYHKIRNTDDKENKSKNESNYDPTLS